MKSKVGDELLDNYNPDVFGVITHIGLGEIIVTWHLLTNNERIDLKYTKAQLSYFLSNEGLFRMRIKPNQIWKELNK